MAKTVRVTTDNKIQILDIPWQLDDQGAAIGADCTEIVSTSTMYEFFKDSIVMLVDESGAVNGRPVNQVASFMYGVQKHGTCIHGDVLFAKLDGPHLRPLKNAELVKFFLKDKFSILEDE